jgi:hypothetical protein
VIAVNEFELFRAMRMERIARAGRSQGGRLAGENGHQGPGGNKWALSPSKLTARIVPNQQCYKP